MSFLSKKGYLMWSMDVLGSHGPWGLINKWFVQFHVIFVVYSHLLTFTHLLTCILLFNLSSHLLVFTVYLPLKMQMWYHPFDGSSWLKLRLASIFMSGCLPEVTVPTVVCLPLSAVWLDLKGLTVHGSVRDTPCVCLYACVWDKEAHVWV